MKALTSPGMQTSGGQVSLRLALLAETVHQIDVRLAKERGDSFCSHQ